MKYFDLTDRWVSIKWIWKNEKNVFEKDFAQYIGTKYALGTSYGRTALYLGLKAIGAASGEVLVPAFTCTVVRQAIVLAGAIPRFVDVDFETFNLDMDDLRRKVSARTKAIILTHYFGSVAQNIEEVILFARENNITLIEDCAHSLGAEYNGGKIGTFGDFSIFSLTKNMINFGGGFFVTNNDNLYEKARAISKEERRGLKARILDFPLVLAYGMEQMIYKLLFDRPGNPKKWWLIHLPRIMVTARNYLLASAQWPRKMIIFRRKSKNETTVTGPNEQRANYGQDINMEPIIASLGRNQLRKIDSLIDRRKRVHEKLIQCSHFHFNGREDMDKKNVYTHIVLRFNNNNIFEIIEQCKKRGLSLIATWPTRQKKWRHLDSEHMARVEKEILLWNINPDLTDLEIERAVTILNTLDDQKAFETLHIVQSGSQSQNKVAKKIAKSLNLNP